MSSVMILVLVAAVAGLAIWLARVRGALRATRDAFDTLATRAPIGIMQTDASGSCTFANDAWLRISGLDATGTLGHEWSRAVHPDDLQSMMEKWERSVRERRPYVNEVRIVRPDGGLRTVLAAAAPIPEPGGTVRGYIGTVLDVTELALARRTLADRERLLGNLLEVQEGEKQRLCHEFHDGLIQYAVGSKMLLESLRHAPLDEAARPVLESVVEYLAKGIEDGRRVIRGIRPQVLDDLGLRAAIDELCAELRVAGIEVEAAIDPWIDAAPASLQTTIYRIVQESLSNVRRHSGAVRVEVRVGRTDGLLEAVVEDRGCGFDPAFVQAASSPQHAGGFGLLGIRERARLAGGSCLIDSQRGGGTTIRVRLPLPACAGEEPRDAAGLATGPGGVDD